MENIYIQWMDDGTIMHMNINNKTISLVNDFNPKSFMYIRDSKKIIDVIIQINECKLMTINNKLGGDYLIWNNDTVLKVAIDNSNDFPINWETKKHKLGNCHIIKGIYL